MQGQHLENEQSKKRPKSYNIVFMILTRLKIYLTEALKFVFMLISY